MACAIILDPKEEIFSKYLTSIPSIQTDYILERTGPSLEYMFLADPLPSGFNSVQFSVKASEEVHVLLSSTKDTSGRAYEIGMYVEFLCHTEILHYYSLRQSLNYDIEC